MKKIITFCLAVSFFSHAQASLDEKIENVKGFIEDTKCRVKYFTPYVLLSTVGMGSFTAGQNAAVSILAVCGFYSLFSTYQGYKEIEAIKENYKVKTKAVDYWNNFYGAEKFLFCRWRQQDNRYDDGYYWPTAWLCNEERKAVRKIFIQDIHAQRIELIVQGKKINNPKPSMVIEAINHELNALENDKKRLQVYTYVHRVIEQPEDFHPDISLWRFLWPNYNRASKLYIELVVMMKRLEVLRDIVALIRSEVADDRWPKA